MIRLRLRKIGGRDFIRVRRHEDVGCGGGIYDVFRCSVETARMGFGIRVMDYSDSESNSPRLLAMGLCVMFYKWHFLSRWEVPK